MRSWRGVGFACAIAMLAVVGCRRAAVGKAGLVPSEARVDGGDREPPEAGATATASVDAADDDDESIATITLPPVTATVRTLGPAEIALQVVATTSPTGTKITIERRTGEGSADPAESELLSLSATGARDHPLTTRHTASPGTSYRYRIVMGSQTSPDVVVRTPNPLRPPLAPSALAVRAEGRFVARVTWTSSGRAVAGFEIQRQKDGDFVRVGLVDPTERAFVHHLRLPGQENVYRVRAFNGAGASASEPATLTMPLRDPARPPPQKPGPCVPPVRNAPKTTACNPEIEVLDNGTHAISSVPDASFGCRRHLMGEYKGCTRELGVFELQADLLLVPGKDDDGWPLLHGIAGAGQYVGAAIDTFAFRDGRYTRVDQAGVCGEPYPDANPLTTGKVAGTLEACTPPFEPCQYDGPER